MSAGTKFTLCEPDNPKKAIHGDFHTRNETATTVSEHLDSGGEIGLFAYSLDSVVVDVDKGSPHQLMLEHQPYAHYPTRSAGHHHLWYPYHDDLIPAYNFAMKGCAGQLLYKSSHVALPNPSVTLSLLYDGLVNTYHHISPIPLFTLLSDKSDSDHIYDDVEGYRDSTPPHPLTTLDTPGIGTRHITILRRTVRALGLKELQSRDDVWAFVLREFHALEDKSDFPQAEAFGIARWIVRLWEGGNLRWAYSRAQRRQGGCTRAERAREATAERDASISAESAAGTSLRELGRKYGLSKSQVDNIIRREKGNG